MKKLFVLAISLSCVCPVLWAAQHQHAWEKTPSEKRVIVGADNFGLPIFSPDTIYTFKTYWQFRSDSVLAFIRCTGCGNYERVYGRRTRGAIWFDSLNAVIDSVLKNG